MAQSGDQLVGMKRASGWLVTAAAAALLLAGCGSDAVPPPSPAMGPQVDLPMPASGLHTPVVTSAGQRVSLASFHGKIVVLSVMMTPCQEESGRRVGSAAGARGVVLAHRSPAARRQPGLIQSASVAMIKR